MNYDDLVASLEGETDLEYELHLGGREFDETVPEGEIISQSPEAGEEKYMRKGDVIVVTVSQGPAQREDVYKRQAERNLQAISKDANGYTVLCGFSGVL